MPINFFGIKIGREDQKAEVKREEPTKALSHGSNDDGATIIQGMGGLCSYYLSLDFSARTETDLVNRYRDIANQPEPSDAITDIVNEAVVTGEGQAVELDLDECRCTPKVKDSIQKEFKTCLRLLDFNNAGPDLFRKWYIDGRIAFQNIIDKKNPATGLLKLIPLDIRKIRKMKNVITSQSESGVEVIDSVEEFFVYSESLGGITNQNSIGMNTASTDQEKAIKILPDSISYATSGLVNHTTGFTFSHLHKAIKPMNQLRMIEDSVVIYRLARAPERRVFNVNTRNLPAQKAEQYVNSVMQKFRSRLVYDSATGQMADDRKHMSVMEDFWFPTDSEGKGTTVTTLPGGANLGEIQDVVYFQKRLYQSLNVPISRLTNPEKPVQIGQAQGSDQILRDELKFARFIDQLRGKFSVLFDSVLKTQLVLRNVISQEDWDDIKEGIQYKFATNSYFSELKKNEIMKQRLEMLSQIKPFIGKFFSQREIHKGILQRTDEEIKAVLLEIENEKSPRQIKKEQDVGKDEDIVPDAMPSSSMDRGGAAHAEPEEVGTEGGEEGSETEIPPVGEEGEAEENQPAGKPGEVNAGYRPFGVSFLLEDKHRKIRSSYGEVYIGGTNVDNGKADSFSEKSV